MSLTQEIKEKLEATFAPEHLEVVDDSESHRGHAGFREGGESHFNVSIRSGKFEGMSRIARHRAVHDALGPEIIGRLHALSLKIDA